MTTPLTAFDADVLIYAATAGHPLGERVSALFSAAAPAKAPGSDTGAAAEPVGVGSVLLLPEVLTKPLRADADSAETAALISLLSRLELLPLTEPTARLALALGSRYGLRAADAAHLATAVAAGADRFLTNNRKDFPQRAITEISVVHPDQLP